MKKIIDGREFFVNGGSSTTPLQCATGNPLESCVDWFSVTFKGNIFLKGLCDMLHLTENDFECKMLAESNEYEYRYSYDNLITIMIRNDNAQGTQKALTHLDIRGQGCRFLENNWRNGVTWVDFFNMLKSAFAIHHITRLDIAIDDYKGYLNISTLHRKMRAKEFRSTAGTRSWRYIENGDMQSEHELTGQTLYVGKGDVEFRFYDKKKQLLNVHSIDLSEIEVWNRYEIQLRQERAQVVMDMIARNDMEIGDLVRSIMAEYLTFLIKSKTDKDKRRWGVCKFWADFLGNVSGVRLTMQPLERSVYKTKNWIEHQAAVAVAVLDECFNDDGYYFKRLVADGQKRMTKQHKQMIKTFRTNENGKLEYAAQQREEYREKMWNSDREYHDLSNPVHMTDELRELWTK